MTDEASVSQRAVRGIAWVALEKWLTRATTLLVFAVLGRLLEPDDFGLMAISFTIALVLSVFVDNGFAQAIVQRRVLDRDDPNTAFWASLGGGALLFALLCAGAPILAHAYGEQQLKYLIPASGLVLITGSLSSVPAAMLEREMDFRRLSIRQLSGVAVGAVGAIALALAGAGVWALVLQPVITGVVSTAVLWWTSSWRPRMAFSGAVLGGLWRFSAQVVGIEFLNSMQSNADKFILGAFVDPKILGYYFIAQRILTIVMEVVAAVLGKVSLTTLSRVQDDPARMVRVFLSMTFGSSMIAFPVFGLMMAFGEDITRLAFGPGWSDSVPLMTLMAPAFMLASVSYFDRSLLLARGRGDVALYVAIGQFVTALVALAISIPLGIVAVSAARTIRQIGYWPVRIIALAKVGGVPPWRYARQFAGPLAGVVIMTVFGRLVVETPWADAPLAPLSFLLPASLLSLGLYVVIVTLVDRARIGAVLNTVRAARRPRS